MSEQILSEYVDVLRRLAQRYPRIDPGPIVSLVVKKGVFVQPSNLSEQVCGDPDDDKFIARSIRAPSCRARRYRVNCWRYPVTSEAWPPTVRLRFE